MEFNLSLSASVADIISYFQGNINNISGELDEGIFDNILDKSFCDSDESEDIDYNLILNLLNNLKLFNNQENFKDMDKVDTELNQIESLTDVYNNANEIDLNIEKNDYEVEKNLLSSEEIEILNKLKSSFENESEVLSNKITEIELSDEQIEVLKKFDNIISKTEIEKPDDLFKINKIDNVKFDDDKNIFKSNLVDSEKFSQLENSNTIDKLNLIRNDDLDESDKDLNTLESILNEESDNKFILGNNQIVNKDMNSINNTSMQEIPTIRQEYIGEDIIKTVKYLKSSGEEEITIKISPKELGDMTIKLTNNSDESNIVITISKSDVFDLVNDNQNEITKHLKDLNINVKEISIEMKDNTQNNFSSNLSQEFERNSKGNNQKNKKNIRSIDDDIDDVEEIYVEENINILI